MTPVTAPPSDLARLLDTERGLEERLHAARAASAAVVARAQETAAHEEETLEGELAEAARQLDERLAAEGRARLAEIAEGADREVQGYERVPAARLAAVARRLAERLLLPQDPA